MLTTLKITKIVHTHLRYPFPFLNFLSIVQCPAHDVRYDSSGVILSPGWPESYPNLQMCSWSVTVEKGYNVTISFESFQTEREFDVLEIFDGKNPHSKAHTDIQYSKNSADKDMPVYYCHKIQSTKWKIKSPFICTISFVLFASLSLSPFPSHFVLMSLRSNSQQSHSGNAERWLASTI